MEENKNSSQSAILWVLVLVSLGLSSYVLFSKQPDPSPLPAVGTTPRPAVQQSQKDLYLMRARNTVLLEGVVVGKTADGLEMDSLLFDIGKIEGAPDSSPLVESQMMKKVRILVSISTDTYFPFKTLDELEVGEKIVVASKDPVREGHIVSATHIYNDIPGI